MSPEYLAGFFDGEGCIDTQRMYPSEAKARFYVRPRVRISQAVSGRCVIDLLTSQFGGYVAFRKAQNSKQQDSVSWEFLDKRGIVKLLRAVEPFLVVKKEQARLVLWWIENMSGRHGKNGPNDPLEAARKLFSQELKLMKQDPQRLSEKAVQGILALMR